MISRAGDRLARALLAIAQRVVPAGRREWADAMCAEFHYLPRNAALHWAIGCLVAAIKSRFAPMNTGTFRINRWVMLVEVLGCFSSLALAWYEFTFGASGVITLNGAATDMYLQTTAGTWVMVLVICFSISGLVGPIGIFLGLRYVFLNRALQSRPLGYALIAAPV